MLYASYVLHQYFLYSVNPQSNVVSKYNIQNKTYELLLDNRFICVAYIIGLYWVILSIYS